MLHIYIALIKQSSMQNTAGNIDPEQITKEIYEEIEVVRNELQLLEQQLKQV